LRYLYDFLKWFAINYSEVAPILSGAFDKVHIPKIGAAQRALKIQQAEQQKAAAALQAKIEQLEKEKEAALEEAQFNELKLAVFKEQQAEEKARLVAQKLERIQPVAREYTEAETRKHLIDAALKEAAWFNLEKGRELEFPVKGMPINRDNPKGNGFVDYVLWDDNGKPLALIEAKRSDLLFFIAMALRPISGKILFTVAPVYCMVFIPKKNYNGLCSSGRVEKTSVWQK